MVHGSKFQSFGQQREIIYQCLYFFVTFVSIGIEVMRDLSFSRFLLINLPNSEYTCIDIERKARTKCMLKVSFT